MQIHQALQDLPRPALHDDQVRVAMLATVLAERSIREKLCDEANVLIVVVVPPIVQRHHILMLQGFQHADLAKDSCPVLGGGERHLLYWDFVPRHLNATSLVERLVHSLLRALPNQTALGIPHRSLVRITRRGVPGLT